jgi:hypothetical protein
VLLLHPAGVDDTVVAQLLVAHLRFPVLLLLIPVLTCSH